MLLSSAMLKSRNIGVSPQPPNLPTSKLVTRHLSLVTTPLIFIFSIFYLAACGLDIEDSTPPSAPVWVEKSFPEEWPERGIDAHESEGIFLEWEPNPIEENVTSYLLYRAEFFEAEDNLGDFDQINRLGTGENSEWSFLDSDVQVYTQYFYTLKAEDASSNVSDFSDTLDYTLLPRISLATMLPNGLSDTLGFDRVLRWTYFSWVEMEDYSLTIVDSWNDLIFRERFTPGNYVSGTESRIIPDSILFKGGQTYRWRIDTGAQYSDQLEQSGSESLLATFLYAGE